MIIEDENLFKEWIARDVESLTDAEADALAKYVLALVKKPLSDKDLEEICLDRLNVFLQNHTRGFVDRLFGYLRKGQYLQEETELSPTLDLSSINDKLTEEQKVDEEVYPRRRRILPPDESPPQNLEENVDGKILPLIRIRDPHHRESRRNRYLLSTNSRIRSPYRDNGEPIVNRTRGICFDFYEKGYCVRGDKCIFDHGSDPVVVEKSGMNSYSLYENPPPPGLENPEAETGPLGGSILYQMPIQHNSVVQLPGSINCGNLNGNIMGEVSNQSSMVLLPDSNGLISLSEHNNILSHVLDEIKATKDAVAFASQRQPLSHEHEHNFLKYPHKSAGRRQITTIISPSTAQSHFNKTPSMTSYTVSPKQNLTTPQQKKTKNFLALMKVQRKRTDLYQRQVEQQRLLLLKTQASKDKEMRKKLLELVERNDEVLKTLKTEIESLGAQIMALKQQTEISSPTPLQVNNEELFIR